MKRTCGIWTGLVTVATLGLSGCGGDPAVSEKSSSAASAAVAAKSDATKTSSESAAVQAAFSAAVSSIEKEGFELRHLTTESQKFVVGGMILALSNELLGDIETLFAKHGLSQKAIKAELEIAKGLGEKDEKAMVDHMIVVGGRVKDGAGFAAEANKLLLIVGAKTLDDLFPKGATLKDIVVTGDTAEAKIVIGDNADDELFLCRQGGAWRIDLVTSLLSAAKKGR